MSFSIPSRASDAGPDSPLSWEIEEIPTCGCCGKETKEQQIWVGRDWNFHACPLCVRECAAIDAAELAAETTTQQEAA